uniref:Uncharacterized protein n=1 Tax=Acrobeloides nanus TaxID=290746 RepID=A0A914CJ85_9BILA
MKNYLTVLLIFLAFFNHVESLYRDFSDNKARTMLTLAAASYSANPMICVHRVLPPKDHWVLVNKKVERCDIIQDTCAVYVIKSNERQQIIVSYRGTVGTKQLVEDYHIESYPDDP